MKFTQLNIKSLYLCIAIGITQGLSANEATPRQTLEQELTHLTAAMQPLLPMVIDDSTQLITAQASEDTFTRTFKIFVPIEDIDAQAFIAAMQPALIEYVGNTDNQKPLLKLEGQHQFVYQALQAEIVADISVSQDNYN